MEGTERIPETIFDEMAGIDSNVQFKSDKSEENVNSSEVKSKINFTRLAEARKSFFKDVNKDFLKSLNKVIRLIASIQDSDINIKSISVSNIEKIEKQLEAERDKEIKNEKKKKSLLSRINEIREKLTNPLKIIKNVAKVLLKIGKFVGNILLKVLKATLKIATKLAKIVFKAIGKILKPTIKKLVKMFKWLLKWMIKIMAKIIRFIFKFVVKLIFRGKKPGTKLFGSEPAPFSFTLKEKAKKYKIKFKMKLPKLKQRVSIIVRFLRMALKPTIRVISTFIRKIITPVFKKLISLAIGMVTDLIFAVIIPGLGFAITALKYVIRFAKIVHFIHSLYKTAKMISNLLSEPSEDLLDMADEEEEELSEDEMETADFRKKLSKLEQKALANSEEYLRIKQRYLESLLDDYEVIGDNQVAELIRKTIKKYPKENLSNLSLEKLDSDIRFIERSREISKMKRFTERASMEKILENEETSVFTKYLQIFRSAVSSIYVELYRRLYKIDFSEGLDMRLSGIYLPKYHYYSRNIDFYNPKKDTPSYDKEKNIIDDVGAISLNLKKSYERYKTFKEKFKKFERFTFDNVVERSTEVKKEVINGTSETAQYRISKTQENDAQKRKYNLWLDILEIVDTNKQFTNKHSRLI